MIYIDQLNRKIEIDAPPRRIISLVPSQTELLYDLGLKDRVVGITKFCIHPEEWFRSKTRVGGTKQIHMDRVHDLQPDFIICNKEENTQEIVEELEKHYPVWVSDIETLEDAYQMIGQLSSLFALKEKGQTLIEEIKKGFDQMNKATSKRVLYFIWKDPWMVAGQDNIINHMIEQCGWTNVCKVSRYPELNVENLPETDLILLSSEPYPFKEKHIEELQQHYPQSKIMLVDGEMFSWYGSRLKYAPAYFSELMNNA